jgi:hypothetical protein
LHQPPPLRPRSKGRNPTHAASTPFTSQLTTPPESSAAISSPTQIIFSECRAHDRGDFMSVNNALELANTLANLARPEARYEAHQAVRP